MKEMLLTELLQLKLTSGSDVLAGQLIVLSNTSLEEAKILF